MKNKINFRQIILFIVLFIPTAGLAQTTEFTYQGSLRDGVNAANGNYDFEFRLFDALSGGGQIGPLVSRNAVVVANGTFAVKLDFGTNFPGADRYLEIRVRNAGGAGFTILDPRARVGSSPYAVKALSSETAVTATNSLQLGGVAANQYVLTGDPRMSDARDPLPGSVRYVQNGTTQQPASSFNISGNGTVGGNLSVGGSFSLNIVNADTQYNIGGSRVLTASTFFGNIFAGIGAGSVNTTGAGNSFFGQGSGQSNVTGGSNSFFGRNAGSSNTASNNSFFGESSGFGTSTGGQNSFFGQFSGRNNITGSENAFFGYHAGQNNTASGNSFFGSSAGDSVTSGGQNAFFGRNAGAAVNTATDNSFFGYNAGLVSTASNNSFFGSRTGQGNTTGERNSFFGYNAGQANTTGDLNSFFGYNAGQANQDGRNNSFFGNIAGNANTGSENSFFGDSAGRDNQAACCNSFFGNHAGYQNMGGRNSFFGQFSGSQNSTGDFNVFIGSQAGNTNTTGSSNTALGDKSDVSSVNLSYATAIGAESVVVASNTVALGRSSGADRVRVYGPLGLNTLDAATSTHLCFNTTTNNVANCTSSIRYKKNVEPLKSGMNLIRQFRPVTYNWKESNQPDLGLIAEEVAEIEPLLITRDNAGEVLGVKYDQLTLILINAIKEQQAQIEKLNAETQELRERVTRQQESIEGLRKLVCQGNNRSRLCRVEPK